MFRKNSIRGFALTMPLLFGCLVFCFGPFAMVLRSAVYEGIGAGEEFIGLGNLWNMLQNRVFILAFGNTAKFLALALPGCLVLAFAIALMLKERANQYSTLKSVLLLPYIMPVVGSVLLVELLFGGEGLLNAILLSLGFPLQDFLKTRWAFGVVLLLYLWKNTGYAVILLLSGLAAIPEEVYAAADLDGAGKLARLRYITLPQMWYSLFFAAVFSLINAFKCFREIFLIGGTHPNPHIYMLQHFINNAFEKLNFSKLAAASALLMCLISAAFALGYGFVMRKEAFRE